MLISCPSPRDFSFVAFKVEISVSGKDWGQEDKGATEDEMVGWHH